ncbi:dihydrodipicolinate synthase family protein [Haoranjiania flava]|uniref:Dihydrodipicolinate synthase family protein n=1 Tax=Haoranjiania flava TaxID=1856322 RepID=A0AAE3IKC9_9BACT|nr:dihydrodipicolinate synthase family protein [Haoranjiania flava]MCU7693877.1 dihydrodipicolinate synthase family protein [Haoranjiania flava]
MKKVEGIIAATFSTFNQQGELDLSLISPVVEKLIGDGVKGVFICGTNGEGLSLSIEERMAIAETYVKVVNKRILVFVHVGHSSLKECKKLAAHAQQIGADAISSVSAFYFKPSSVGNLVDCMAEIASAAPLLPFYYYHMPALTGIAIDMLEFLKLAETKIPNLAGIKYTATTMHEFQSCLHYKQGKYDILYGYDEMLLTALSVGAKGAIGSTYSFAAPLYLKIIDLFKQGRIEEAGAVQYESIQMIRALVKYSPIPTQKKIIGFLGYDLGPCRLPLTALSREQENELKQYLEEVRFFQSLENARMHLNGELEVAQ